MKNAQDQKHTVGALFMDLPKAFDCLPHGLLVSKLHAYGLTPATCQLLGDYLCGCRQRVKISNARSPWKTLAKGVPRGSFLGPLLLNIFINDMFYFIGKYSLYNYADDNPLSISAPTAEEVLSNLKDGPLARYVKLGVRMRWGLPGTFSPLPRVSDHDMHHGTCVTHVPGCMPGSLTSGFLWSRWRGKRSRHSRRMHNPQFYVSTKRPMAEISLHWYWQNGMEANPNEF